MLAKTRRDTAQIVKLSSKVGEVVVAGRNLFKLPVNFTKLLEFVKGYLGNRCFAFEPCIPGAAAVVVEPAALWRGMRKGRVHDLTVGDAVEQFVHADSRKQAFFAKQPGVGCAVQLDQLQHFPVIIRELGEHSSFCAVFRWDETVSAGEGALAYRRIHCPPRRASSNCRTSIMPGCPRRSMYSSGVVPRNIGLLLGSVIHASARRSL